MVYQTRKVRFCSTHVTHTLPERGSSVLDSFPCETIHITEMSPSSIDLYMWQFGRPYPSWLLSLRLTCLVLASVSAVCPDFRSAPAVLYLSQSTSGHLSTLQRWKTLARAMMHYYRQ